MILAARLVVPVMCALAASAAIRATASEPYPYTLGVRVSDPRDVAREGLRESFEAVAANAAHDAGCFREVRLLPPAPGPDDPAVDVVLEVRFIEVESETTNDLSIAQRARSEDPEDAMRFTVRVRVDTDVALRSGRSGGTLRAKAFRAAASERPRFLADDPQARISEYLRGELERFVGRFLCKDSAARLRRELERAEGGAPAR